MVPINTKFHVYNIANLWLAIQKFCFSKHFWKEGKVGHHGQHYHFTGSFKKSAITNHVIWFHCPYFYIGAAKYIMFHG